MLTEVTWFALYTTIYSTSFATALIWFVGSKMCFLPKRPNRPYNHALDRELGVFTKQSSVIFLLVRHEVWKALIDRLSRKATVNSFVLLCEIWALICIYIVAVTCVNVWCPARQCVSMRKCEGTYLFPLLPGNLRASVMQQCSLCLTHTHTHTRCALHKACTLQMRMAAVLCHWSNHGCRTRWKFNTSDLLLWSLVAKWCMLHV